MLCLAAGLLSIALGQDACWDLQNYHLYNAFAWLRHRHDIDIAQVQSFLNPLLDVPLYLLMLTFAHAPRAVAFCMGLPYGVLAFFTLRVSLRLVGRRRDDVAAAIIAALFGLCGTATASQIGLSTNEIPVAALVMAGFDFLLAAILEKPLSLGPLLAAGFLVGVAAGAKLTALPYAAGLAFAALAGLPLRRWALAWLAIGIAGAGGAALTGGFWMAHLGHLYGNPIFPYDNQIFGSPWAGPWGYNDTRFYPRSTLQAVFYPFWWLKPTVGLVTESPFADPRFAAVYLAAAVSLAAALFRHSRAALVPSPRWRAVMAFWLVSYLLWERLFSIYRYTIPLELTGCMLIIGAVRSLRPGQPRLATGVAAALAAALALSSTYPNWGRIAFQDRAIPVTMPAMPPRSMVVSTTGSAVSFLAVRAPKQTVFVGGNDNFVVPDSTLIWRRTTDAIESWRGPIEIVEPAGGDPVARDVIAAEYNLIATSQCQTIVAAWNQNGLRLCDAHLLAGAPGYQPAISFGFATGDVSDQYVRDGWAAPESWGRWSMAADATIVLPVNPANTHPLKLTVLAYGLPSATQDGRHADLYANGQLIAQWRLAPQPANYQAIIPDLHGASRLTLRFHLLDPATQAEQTALGDARALGIGMMRLSVQEILAGDQ